MSEDYEREVECAKCGDLVTIDDLPSSIMQRRAYPGWCVGCVQAEFYRQRHDHNREADRLMALTRGVGEVIGRKYADRKTKFEAFMGIFHSEYSPEQVNMMYRGDEEGSSDAR